VTELLHITDSATWAAARRDGEYRMSTRGVTLDEQGFIHCSLRHQVRGPAEFLYNEVDEELVVLVIEADMLTAPVRFEAPEPGAEEFPHIYGPVPVDAVVEVIPVGRDADGRLILPE
jgi:uncharacterized protein (DUF952 family)